MEAVSNVLERYVKKPGAKYGYLVGIEQPFPVGFPRYVPLDEASRTAWKLATKRLRDLGLEVFADESCNG